MSEISAGDTPVEERALSCAAALLRQSVNEAQDAASRAALHDAANGGPEIGTDDYASTVHSWRNNVHLGGVRDCVTCGGHAALSHSEVVVDKCLITGSCEDSWADMHPEHYGPNSPVTTPPLLPCGGLECTAVVRLRGEDGLLPPTGQRLIGACAVEEAGITYHRNGGMQPLLDTIPTNPDLFEPFDGEPVYFEPTSP